MRTRKIVGACAAGVLVLAGAALAYARYFHEAGADRAFDTRVPEPALVSRAPRVLFDHGHRNVHSIRGRYAPFADLIRADGCRVSQCSGRFTEALLGGVGILVVVNARGPESDRSQDAAFTAEECALVEGWVRAGGSLLLVVDHYPCGPAAAGLGARFGVTITGGWTDDEANARAGSSDPGQLCSRGTRGIWAITRSRGGGAARSR